MSLKTKSILKTIRIAVGLNEDTTDFDTDLLIHINGAIGKLNQNGVNSIIYVNDETTTWSELDDPINVEGNKISQMFPIYVTLSTKMLFDPPPPSTIEYYARNIDEILWRIKIAYETTEI